METDEKLKRSLRSSTLEGAFSSASNSIKDSYTVPFLLSIKATSGDIGVLTAIQSLASILAQIPGARLTNVASRKAVWMFSTIIARIIWIPILVMPFLTPWPVFLVICLMGAFAFFQALKRPA